MTDQLDTAILKAGVDLLRTDSLLNVQDGFVADLTPRPYVLVYGWVGRPEDADSNALDGLSRTFLARWYIHCVGDTRESASAISQRVRSVLLDVTPAITGHPNAACGLIKQETANQPTVDETTGTPVFDAICVYKLRVTT